MRPYRPYQTTAAQVRSIGELLIGTLRNRTVTTYGQIHANIPNLGPAQRNNVLYMFSKVSSAVDLDYVTALVQREHDPEVGEGFWNYFAPAVPANERPNWLEQHRQALYEKAAALIRLVEFIISEAQREEQAEAN